MCLSICVVQPPNLGLTWKDLVAREPELASLLTDAQSLQDNGGEYFCSHEAYTDGYGPYPSFKNRLNYLVGWYRPHKDPVLVTSEAWWVALQTILRALPPCRHCLCLDENGNLIP